ncbi:MAG: hypothetical protein QG597_777 [Actinomycetota bacterium]|nr:hypothetical protein [Actinomycetota bacterium]
MTAVRRAGTQVAKTLDRRHLSGALRLEHATGAHASGYLADLRAVGVALPDEITVTSHDGEIGVRHRWVEGTALRDLAASAPEEFVDATFQIASWVDALRHTSSRLDTNLDNFVVDSADGRITCVDVLPPIRTDLARTPASPWQEIITGLCLDTDTTLCALAGYAHRALTTTADTDLTSITRAAVRSLCRGHSSNSLSADWFHSRLLASEHPEDPHARRLWDATSVSALIRTPPPARPARLARALELIRTSPREHS